VGLKLHWGPLEWHHVPTKFHLPGGSKDIHRSFITKVSNAFRSFLSYSKQLALVSMVTSLPLCHFLPYNKLHALVTTVTSAKDCMWCNHGNPIIKQSQTTGCARLKIMPATNNYEPQPFSNSWRCGIKNYCTEFHLNGFMKIYEAVQKVLVGDPQTHRQTGDVISILLFFECRLKWVEHFFWAVFSHSFSSFVSSHLSWGNGLCRFILRFEIQNGN
jgi:hypothetical protein